MGCIKHILLVWIAVFSAVILQAQEQLEVELIGESRSYSAMLPLDKNEFLVVTNGDENGQIALCHMMTDGTELEYVNQPQLNEQGCIMTGRMLLFRMEDDALGIIYHKQRNDSVWVAVGDIDEDLMINETGSVLVSAFGLTVAYYDYPEFIIENDSTFAMSYFTNDQPGQTLLSQFRIIRSDKWGNVLADRAFSSRLFDTERLFAFNADSTGYLVGGGDVREQPFQKRCYNLDFNLDTTLIHDEIYWDFPLPGWRGDIIFPYVAKHPKTGCLYLVGSAGRWEINGQEVRQDAIIAKFDQDMTHIDRWDVTMDSPNMYDDQRAFWKSIDFFPDGSIAVCALVKHGFYVGHLDEDLNKFSEVFVEKDYALEPLEICAMPNGDCLVTTVNNQIFHIIIDPTGVEEPHNPSFVEAEVFPNPGHNMLNIRTGLRDAWVEVYDMNGRLIHSQAITENVTRIDAGGWAEGVYVWKVVSNGKEVENGKWIKNDVSELFENKAFNY